MLQAQIDMIKSAIQSHNSMLYAQIEGYKDQGNTEAVKDCLAEIKKFKDLSASLKPTPVMNDEEKKEKANRIVHGYGYHEGNAVDYDYAVDMVVDAFNLMEEKDIFNQG